jgi:hypothetical protein
MMKKHEKTSKNHEKMQRKRENRRSADQIPSEFQQTQIRPSQFPKIRENPSRKNQKHEPKNHQIGKCENRCCGEATYLFTLGADPRKLLLMVFWQT